MLWYLVKLRDNLTRGKLVDVGTCTIPHSLPSEYGLMHVKSTKGAKWEGRPTLFFK